MQNKNKYAYMKKPITNKAKELGIEMKRNVRACDDTCTDCVLYNKEGCLSMIDDDVRCVDMIGENVCISKATPRQVDALHEYILQLCTMKDTHE